MLFKAFQKMTAADLFDLQRLTENPESYPVQWLATGSPPALNNTGSINGAFIKADKLVIAWGNITMGAATTFGTGPWRVTMPLAAGPRATVGSAYFLDFGTFARPGVTYWPSATTIQFFAESGEVDATHPHVWANGDQVTWSVMYWAA